MTIADPDVGGHTPEFAVAAASERGNRAMLRAAKAMAMTAVDLLAQPELMAQAQDEFRQMINPDAAWRQKRFFS